MRGFISVFALMARSTLLRCVGIICAMTALESGFFFYMMERQSPAMGLEEILEHWFFYFTVELGFLIIAELLASPFSLKGSNCFYTLKRLPASRRQITVACSLYSLCILLSVIAVQTVLFFAFCQISEFRYQHSAGIHAVFLAFVRCPLIMSILPVFQPLVMLRNMLALACVSLTAGTGVTLQHKNWAPSALLLLLIFWLRETSYSLLFIGILGYAVFLAFLIFRLFRTTEEDDGFEEKNSFETVSGGENYA